MMIDSLKKQLKAIDLCLGACRRRQSPRTGFVHYFPGGEEPADTIPLYENFCFAAALYRNKTVESALEGKELLERLLSFQASDGSFPVYIHEFPRSRDWMQGLKIAPLLIQLLRRFPTVLQPELKQKLSSAIEKILEFSKDKVSGHWQTRYRMCKEKSSIQNPEPSRFSSSDWTDWLISAQLGESGPIPLAHLFHKGLQAFIGPAHADIQEGFEPRPCPIEWLLAEKEESFSERLLRDHPLQMHLAALWPLESISEGEPGWPLLSTPDRAITWQTSEQKSAHLLRILWCGEQLHSLVLPQMKAKATVQDNLEILFDLPEEADQSRNDLFEIAFYCDATPEIDLTINGKKGTAFYLGDSVEIKSPTQSFSIHFELTSGSGDFRGHLSRSNRPVQTAVKNFEAYDWQIGLRTLRRSPNAQIRAIVQLL